MNILVLLPSSRRGIDTVPEIVLQTNDDSDTLHGNRRDELTSLSLSADTSDHLNSACPPLVPPLMGSYMVYVLELRWTTGVFER